MIYREEVMRNCPSFEEDYLEKKLSLGALGVAGEAGEVADLIKKILHHDVDLESVREKLIKEMGDVHWYLEYLAATLGISTNEVLEANVKKLRARHPNGWTPQSQQAKRDELPTTHRDQAVRDEFPNHMPATNPSDSACATERR